MKLVSTLILLLKLPLNLVIATFLLTIKNLAYAVPAIAVDTSANFNSLNQTSLKIPYISEALFLNKIYPIS
jgi:hypothetical protein